MAGWILYVHHTAQTLQRNRCTACQWRFAYNQLLHRAWHLPTMKHKHFVATCRTDNAVKNRWASLTKKNPKLASGSPGSAPSASGDSSFSGSVPSQSRSGQSNQGSLQPTRLPGTLTSPSFQELRTDALALEWLFLSTATRTKLLLARSLC